ncbi:MAG: PQQ-binding-like beta-propeller repeat protein, partial [Planctomycetes bacterium]|nr:PQQ-binding-like beta-propeller repeat protein [Planctomycetota bacterium]
MFRMVICSLIVVASAASAALGQADYLAKEALRGAGLAKFWQFQLPLDAKQRLAEVYLVDDQLYCATDDGYVLAVHAHTGALRWIKKVTDASHRIARPAHSGGRTLFLSDIVLTQVDRLTGEGIMRRELGPVISSAPVSTGGVVYFGSVDRRFYAHDLYSGFEFWKVGTNGQISSRPVIWQGDLFVASHDGAIYSCSAANKRYRWVARTRGANSADLAVDENGLYVASRDHSLYQFDVGFGQIRWRARFSGPLYDPPVLTPELAYQYSRDDGLAAIETGTIDVKERFRWKIADGLSLLTVDETYAYVL